MPTDNTGQDLTTQMVRFCLFNTVVFSWLFFFAFRPDAFLVFFCEICGRLGTVKENMVMKVVRNGGGDTNTVRTMNNTQISNQPVTTAKCPRTAPPAAPSITRPTSHISTFEAPE